MTESHKPFRLAASQRERAAKVLTRAFQDDPMMMHVLPSESERQIALHWLFGKVVRYCHRYGEAFTDLAVTGVACWLPPGDTELTFWRILRTGLLALPIHLDRYALQRFFGTLTYADRVHKLAVKEPHWYLWVLGVEPSYQRRGIGGKLLEPVLDKADTEKIKCFLETQNEQNVAFYEKRGFEVVNEGIVPGQGLKIWSMLRQPHG